MRIVITGAAGFVGEELANVLASNPNALNGPISSLVLADLHRGETQGNHVTWCCGDLTDQQYLDTLFAEPVDCLFHLTSVPGSLAEREPERGWSVNLIAPINLAKRLARQGRETGRVPKVMFASTIAVYGALGPETFHENHETNPTISYGAHKLMIEMLLADLTRRGEIDAISLRLPGIVARPPSETGHGSAFMSQIFHKARAAEPYACPVSPDATAWWMSRKTCVANLIHAARMDLSTLGPSRQLQLPALHASIGDILTALGQQLGRSSIQQIWHAPDPLTETLFGRFPPIKTPLATAAGFVGEGSSDDLVRNVFDQ